MTIYAGVPFLYPTWKFKMEGKIKAVEKIADDKIKNT